MSEGVRGFIRSRELVGVNLGQTAPNVNGIVRVFTYIFLQQKRIQSDFPANRPAGFSLPTKRSGPHRGSW